MLIVGGPYVLRPSVRETMERDELRQVRVKVENIEEGFIRKARQTVVVAFWGKMTAHAHSVCVAEELIKAGQAIVTCVLTLTN